MLRTFIASLATLVLGGYALAACNGPGSTTVEEIYPSGDMVPENLLRFYLYFSGPMSDADILPSIVLRKADGTPVEGPFLSNRFDLWSPDRTRLTLLFDPGRVKTGLEAHNALGRALAVGERYVLTVSSEARDAKGCELRATFSHSFVAGPIDTETPDPGVWEIDFPNAGTKQSIGIALGSAHDHLSLAFRIKVRADGENIPGRISLDEAETVWRFTPSAPWSNRPHEIAIGKELEDLAGNRPGQLFDQPVGLELPRPNLYLPFKPRTD